MPADLPETSADRGAQPGIAPRGPYHASCGTSHQGTPYPETLALGRADGRVRAPSAMTSELAGRAHARLAQDGVVVGTWANGPHDRYPSHAHDYDKVLVVIEGSIVFRLIVPGTTHSLEPGDRLDLPAGTVHAADVGPRGVRCLEGHLPAGTLRGDARRVAAWVTDATRSPDPEPMAAWRRSHP